MSISRPDENVKHNVSVKREGAYYVYTFHPRPDHQETLRLTEGLKAILPEGLVNNKLGFAELEIDPAHRKKGEKSTYIVLLIGVNTPKNFVDKIFAYLSGQDFARMNLTTETYPNLPESDVPDTHDKIRESLRRVDEM